jgi:retinol dehydrogenase 14
MAGKTVLVTGGTGGIGKATAAGLARLGARVGIVGRDERRAETAAADIRSGTDAAMVDVFAADMSSQAPVRQLATDVLDRYPRLAVLINNVGGFWATRHPTADGLEHTFAVNHLAPFLLTNLLLDRLTARTPARVVTVSSEAQAMGRIDFDDLQGTPEQGAATSVYLASSNEVEGITGQYFANSKPKRSAERSYDTDIAARLWTVSATLVGLVNDRPGFAASS